jgi:hypothetical protein
LWPKAACPWVVRVSVVSLHTRCRAFPPQHLAQHLLPPSPMHYNCATVTSAFILRRCAPVTIFVYHARRLFERACRTGAGAITPSTQARQCSNSPLAVVGAFHFARKSIAWDFRIFVNKIDAKNFKNGADLTYHSRHPFFTSTQFTHKMEFMRGVHSTRLLPWNKLSNAHFTCDGHVAATCPSMSGLWQDRHNSALQLRLTLLNQSNGGR